MIEKKFDTLVHILKDYAPLAIAFSGGVDSSLLAYAAREAVQENVLALTLALHSTPKRDLEEAKQFCQALGIRHHVVSVDELSISGFKENPPDRCYICKKGIFKTLLDLPELQSGYVLCEGSNVDDLSDYRPGRKALTELDIKSPLIEADLSKAEIRELLFKFGLAVWQKPSAACLSSRIMYGQVITEQLLDAVDKAESFLLSCGFMPGLRVRVHGNLARIETAKEDFIRFTDEKLRKQIDETFRTMGFLYTSVDIRGYRMGSLNEGMGDNE